MAQEVTLGGERIGSGNKQKVELHNYGMTSFNLEQDWKSSMAPGILYPFLKLVGTNHGTFDIDLDSFIRTLPTKGPLFGQFKFQADIYCVPIRLYQGILHNNPVGIGLKMNQVYLPKIRFKTIDGTAAPRVKGSNDYNFQVNESSLMKYLGLSGIGRNVDQSLEKTISRKINAIPFLAYYDIFKCYYSNKQEEKAYVITPGTPSEDYTKVTSVLYDPKDGTGSNFYNPYIEGTKIAFGTPGAQIEITLFYLYGNKKEDFTDLVKEKIIEAQELTFYDNSTNSEIQNITNLVENYNAEITWKYNINPNIGRPGQYNTIQLTISLDSSELANVIDGEHTATKFEALIEEIAMNRYSSEIYLKPFALQNIDDMRNALLSSNTLGTEFLIGDGGNWDVGDGSDETGLPYAALTNVTNEGITWNAFTDNGLVVKTYQSDLFNNWLNTEYIDGESGISALTAVTVSDGSFTIDSLNLAEKIYEVLNRVAVSGGTYEDWQEAVYGEGAVRKAETPMYIGGMSAEVMFEEVISTAETNVESGEGLQALGSLGGKGTQVGKHGGNNIHVKCEEPCYIIGIASLTPRIAYSQGNDWDLTELDTLDDLHKPALDGIGFQDLIVEQMAWWNTALDGSTLLGRSSAGKQTAWINYQTAVDKCYGDFAKADENAFMVLNRNYEKGDTITGVKDITTYIDPAKYNYAFAYTKLDAQNFWCQIHSRVVARRKMGAQQIPNL